MAIPAAMSNQVEGIKPTWKSRVAAVILTSLVLILMVLANLPYQYVEAESEWIGAMEFEDARSEQQYPLLPRMAGWPLRYWVQYQQEGNVHQDRFWSPPRLIGNLIVTLVLGGIVYGYIQLRNRQLRTARNRRFTRSMFDAGTALAILLAPALVIAWEHRITNQHRQLAGRLTRYGNVHLSVWLPDAIVDHVPSRLMPSLAKLRHVYVTRLDPQLVRTVAEVPTLVGFYCYGGSFETSAIEPLGACIHLSALELRGRALNESDIDLIARLRWLTTLNLSRTNLDSQMLRRFDDLPLRTVDLTRTPLKLSELGMPGWSATAEELYLTRPAQGDSGSLTIEGWPRLKRLSATRASAKMNPSVFKVRLIDLPSLQQLTLDRLQKHDCVFRDLPRWSYFDEGLSALRFILHGNDLFPGSMWLSNLEVDGASSIESIQCFARDLESISIRRVPAARTIAIGSFYTSTLGAMSPRAADPGRCQTWIEQLGDRDGPGTIDLTALPLAGVDLAPLAKNRRIRNLQLGLTGVTFKQLQQLAGMEQIESLDIGSCVLERDQLSWLLQRFPNLKDLSIDGTSLTKFELKGNSLLKSMRVTPLEDVRELRMVDLPSLKIYVRCLRAPERMEIRNAPSLMGLAIEAPWPTDATIEGLRDLEWFAAGGMAINDSVLDVLLRCGELDQLTLAYTSISREKLREIGRLDRLSLLALPGASIDDSITADWHRLKSLWEVNFDDTSVSGGTIGWLSRIESLRRVTLNRVPIDEVTADALSELGGVSELHLAGVSLAPEKLVPLLAQGNLEGLNLSGWKIDDNLIEILAAAPSLQQLILHDTNIDGHSLERILTANPLVFVDLGEAPDFLTEEWAAELRRRAIRLNRDASTGWRQSLRHETTVQLFATDADDRSMAWIESSRRSGRLDTQLFRPKPDSLRARSVSD